MRFDWADFFTFVCVTLAIVVVGFIIYHTIDNAQYASHEQRMACIERADSDLALMVCRGART